MGHIENKPLVEDETNGESSPDAGSRAADDPTALMRVMIDMMHQMTVSLADLQSNINHKEKKHDSEPLHEEYGQRGRPIQMSYPNSTRNSVHERNQPSYSNSIGMGLGSSPVLPKIQLERYSGIGTKTLPANWMRNYERMAVVQNWSDQFKTTMLPFYLTDEASTWFDNHVSQDTMTWYEIKERFERFFSQDKIVTPKMVATKEWDPKVSTFYEHYKEMLRLFEISKTPHSWQTQILQTSLPPYFARMCSGVEEDDTDAWYRRAAKIICNLPKYEGKSSTRVFEANRAKDTKVVAAIQDIKTLARKAPIDQHDKTEDPSKCLFCNQINPSHKLEDCFCHPRKLRARLGGRGINVLEDLSDTEEESSEAVLGEEDLEGELSECSDLLVLQKIPGDTEADLVEPTDSISVLSAVSNRAKMLINEVIEVEGLIDSGASVCAISKHLCTEWNIMVYPKKRDLSSVHGPFTTEGMVYISVRIGPYQGRVKAYVIESPPYPFILGINEFKTFGISWSYPYLVKEQANEIVAQVQTIPEEEVATGAQTIESRLHADVQQLTTQYSRLFSTHDFDVGHTTVLECSIHLKPDTVPHHVPARRLSLKLQQEEAKQVAILLEHQLIQPSFSEWAAGITFVCREGKSPRLCGDYRKLNEATISDRYPIPRIDFILDQLKGACIFSKLDLTRGYNNLGIHEKDRYKTAFITNVGLYEWRVVPFGLKNAPALFQRCMEIILFKCKDFAKVYFDDILVHSRTENEHLKHLESVFTALSDHNVKLKINKCLFMKDQVNFCGYVIRKGTVRRDATFTEAIDRIRVPKDLKELMSFMGLANYGRRFIANFAELAKPLNELRKKDVDYVWKPEHQACFEKLKQVLKSAPSLHLFDPDLKSVLYTDASQLTNGAVLVQLKCEKDVKLPREYPVGFFSRSLDSAQLKYDIYTKEFLALKEGIRFFKEYLYGRRFTVVTDNTALSYLKSSKDVLDKRTRWLMMIEQFDFELIHKPSSENKAADALSRITDKPTVQSLCVISHAVRTLVREASNSEEPILVPRNKIKEILDYFHKDKLNHGGFEKIQPLVKSLFLITNQEIKDYLLGCYPCRMVNQGTTKVGFSRPMESPQRVNERWHLDFIQGLPRYRGQGNVLVIIDQTSRYVRAYLIGRISVDEITGVLGRAFRRGTPNIMVVDNATCFTATSFREFCMARNIQLIFVPAHHHQSNGLAERVLKTIQEALTKYVIEVNASWWTLLPAVVRKYNNTVHRGLGATPKQVYEGQVDLNSVLVRTEQQQRYDAGRLNKNAMQSKFKVGDLVLLKLKAAKRRKLKSKRSGPFRIVRLVSEEIVEVEHPTRRLPTQGGYTRVHVDDIVLFKPFQID